MKDSWFLFSNDLSKKKYYFVNLYDLCGNCKTSIDLKFIHTVKGDKFYFGHDVKTSCQPVEVVEEHDFSL